MAGPIRTTRCAKPSAGADTLDMLPSYNACLLGWNRYLFQLAGSSLVHEPSRRAVSRDRGIAHPSCHATRQSCSSRLPICEICGGPCIYVARSVRPTKSRSRARGRLSCSMQQAFAKPKPIQRLDHIQAHGERTSVRLHVRYVSQACCPRPRGNLTSHTSLRHKATGQLCAGNAACHALHRVPTY